MTQHYYSQHPEIKSQPNLIQVQVDGLDFSFKTDSGVFSKMGLDYGTRVLLEAMQFPDVEGPVLDVGCGYGPIGIVLKKRDTDRQVTMVDVNERAVELAKENAELNGVTVDVLQSYLFERVQGLYSLIVSNPPIRAGKAVVHQILEESCRYLKEEGELWIVIQKKQGAPSAIDKLKSLFQEVEVVKKDKGYYVIRALNAN